jgi:hypothetical protein
MFDTEFLGAFQPPRDTNKRLVETDGSMMISTQMHMERHFKSAQGIGEGQ